MEFEAIKTDTKDMIIVCYEEFKFHKPLLIIDSSDMVKLIKVLNEIENKITKGK